MSERRCFGCMRMATAHVCEHCGWPADGNNDPHQLPVGTILQGKYMVGRVLGQGGFGITYLGWDMNLDIQVCIKEFYPSSTVNRDVTRSTVVNCNTTNMEGYYAACLERFLREGKALAKFRNVPQIVGIHDFFQLNNTAYMVMEFVSGIDMAKYVQKRGGRLHMDEILKILRPVMEALQLVHDAGIIHRDISPDNIMLEPREGAKLLDFGAVRNVEHPDAEKELTRATEAILKNGFAPMEQYVAKGSLGPWTDVYAMSATIYYCLTGRIPEDSPIRLMEGTPLDWTGAQGLTEHQKTVLEKGMEPRAKDRISSIRELMEKLYAVEAAPAPVPTPQREKDPLKTDIISEFKVVMPPEPQKQPEKQPEPAPAPVVAEPQKQPEERVILPASRKVEEPVQPQQPEKKRDSLWVVTVAVFLLVAILLGIFLMSGNETGTPQVSNQQATTKPTELPLSTVETTQLNAISTPLKVITLSAQSGLGFVLDDEGNVWFWDNATMTIRPTGITGGVSFAKDFGAYYWMVPLLKMDGSISLLEINEDYDATADTWTYSFAGEKPCIISPGNIEKMFVVGAYFYVITTEGELYRYPGYTNKGELITIPGRVVDMDIFETEVMTEESEIGFHTVYKYSAVCDDGSVYRWEYNEGTGVLTDPEKSDITGKSVVFFMSYRSETFGAEMCAVLGFDNIVRIYDHNGAEIVSIEAGPDCDTLYSIGRSACYLISDGSLICVGQYKGGPGLNNSVDDCIMIDHGVISEYRMELPGKTVEFAPGGWSNIVRTNDGSIFTWGQEFAMSQIIMENGEPFHLE